MITAESNGGIEMAKLVKSTHDDENCIGSRIVNNDITYGDVLSGVFQLIEHPAGSSEFMLVSSFDDNTCVDASDVHQCVIRDIKGDLDSEIHGFVTFKFIPIGDKFTIETAQRYYYSAYSSASIDTWARTSFSKCVTTMEINGKKDFYLIEPDAETSPTSFKIFPSVIDLSIPQAFNWDDIPRVENTQAIVTKTVELDDISQFISHSLSDQCIK
jgi:hypothetical protein